MDETVVPYKPVPFEELATADLIVDQVYLGGNHLNISGSVLPPLLGVGNAAGFRSI